MVLPRARSTDEEERKRLGSAIGRRHAPGDRKLGYDGIDRGVLPEAVGTEELADFCFFFECPVTRLLAALRHAFLRFETKACDNEGAGHFGRNSADGQDVQRFGRRLPEKRRGNVQGVHLHFRAGEGLAHLRDDPSVGRKIAVHLRRMANDRRGRIAQGRLHVRHGNLPAQQIAKRIRVEETNRIEHVR